MKKSAKLGLFIGVNQSMVAKSKTDIAYDILSSKKRAIQFQKLWEDVAKKTGASNDMIAQFYEDLSLDSRFTQLKENKWDLVERRKFAESHVDISKIELGDDVPEEGENSEDDNLLDEDKY